MRPVETKLERVRSGRLKMKMLFKMCLVALALTTLPATYATASGVVRADSVWVDAQLLRDATQRIDALELEAMLLRNRLAERDSVLVIREREQAERERWLYEYAERAKAGIGERVLLAVVLGVGFWLGGR
jgi:hypothetical protein